MRSESIKVEVNEASPEAAADAAMFQLGAVLDKQSDKTLDLSRRIQQLEAENRALLEANVRQQETIEGLETECNNLRSRNSLTSNESLEQEDERKLELLQTIADLEAQIADLQSQGGASQPLSPVYLERRIPEYPTSEDFESIDHALDWAEDQIIRLDDEAQRREARLKSQLVKAKAKSQNANADASSIARLKKQVSQQVKINRSLEEQVAREKQDKQRLLDLLEKIRTKVLSQGKKPKSGATRGKTAPSRRAKSQAIAKTAPSETPDYPNPLKSIQEFSKNNQ